MIDTTKLYATTAVCFAVVLLLAGGGCSEPKRVGPKQATNWAYAPHTIEVHPLSRFKNPTTPDEETVIMVYVEFKDGDGFTCRGIGVLDVSLLGKNGQVLATEIVPLQDENVNFTRFDRITRTYQIRFDKVPTELDRVAVMATFTALGDTPIVSRKYTIKNNH